MDIAQYIQVQGDQLSFNANRASAFAKQIAGDFNPLHDPENKRFCVPGDLLFSALLYRFGLFTSIEVEFATLVDDTATLVLPATLEGSNTINDTRDRACLHTRCEGDTTTDANFIAAVAEAYVRFSGQTFPDILEPLMRRHNVMINPARPLVIYQAMQVSLNELSGQNVSVQLADATLDVDGKRGEVQLHFSIAADGTAIGEGSKTMVLGGLRPYDADAMRAVVDEYNALKSAG